VKPVFDDSHRSFEAIQRAHHAEADPEHYAWQTGNPAIRDLEEALFSSLSAKVTGLGSILEVGCGEGGNLVTLRRLGHTGTFVGVDLSFGKARFGAGRHSSGAHFVQADAAALPFRDAAFETVMSRDLLHHVSDRERLVREIARVARRRAILIEPNPLSPLIAGFALLRRAERGMLTTTVASMQRLLKSVVPQWKVTHTWTEPQNLSRLLFHYQFGLPGLAEVRWLRFASSVACRVATAMPFSVWAYQVHLLERPSNL
jgi:ubiquinone/menaquinone biosynthesis C-methylase UbiE